MNYLAAEYYLPHRGVMKLIDRIVHVDTDKAITESQVSDQWPLVTGTCVSPIVFVELAAQTAGIYIAWNKEKEKLRTGKERGWVVGISSASFFSEPVRVASTLTTYITSKLSVDTYMKLNGKVYLREELAGEIGLQLFWVESEDI